MEAFRSPRRTSFKSGDGEMRATRLSADRYRTNANEGSGSDKQPDATTEGVAPDEPGTITLTSGKALQRHRIGQELARRPPMVPTVPAPADIWRSVFWWGRTAESSSIATYEGRPCHQADCRVGRPHPVAGPRANGHQVPCQR